MLEGVIRIFFLNNVESQLPVCETERDKSIFRE